jgi:hypothetical protein
MPPTALPRLPRSVPPLAPLGCWAVLAAGGLSVPAYRLVA